MANHGFVTSRRKIDPDKVDDIIRRLNKEKFGELLEITREEWDDYEGPAWQIQYRDEPNMFQIWLATSRKIEIRHSHRGDFMWWVDSSITNEIALAIGGTISDEGVEERWKGEPDYCPHFKDYLRKIWMRTPIEMVLEFSPKETWDL